MKLNSGNLLRIVLIPVSVLSGCASGSLTLDTAYLPEYERVAERLALSESSAYDADPGKDAFPQQITRVQMPAELQLSAIPAGQEIEIRRDGNGYPVIIMPVPLGKAWDDTAGALESAGLKIASRSRNLSTFTLRSFESGNPDPLLAETGELEIVLRQVQGGTELTIQRSESELAPLDVTDRVAQKLLDALEAG